MSAPSISKGKAKKLKQKLAKGGGTAQDALAIFGADARASVELLPQTVPPRPLALGDVQNVLLWALTADAGEMPKWLCVRNKPLIRGAIFILAEL